MLFIVLKTNCSTAILTLSYHFALQRLKKRTNNQKLPPLISLLFASRSVIKSEKKNKTPRHRQQLEVICHCKGRKKERRENQITFSVLYGQFFTSQFFLNTTRAAEERQRGEKSNRAKERHKGREMRVARKQQQQQKIHPGVGRKLSSAPNEGIICGILR